MSQILARCIQDTTIPRISVGEVYQVEHDTDWKIIYHKTDKTYKSVIGNKEWFYEHFLPIRCNDCKDMKYCNTYKQGREYACYGFC